MTTITAWKPPVPDLPPTTVVGDRWDRNWFAQAHDSIGRLAELTAELQDITPGGHDAMTDLFFTLSKGRPALEAEVRPDRAVNRLVAEQLLEAEGIQDLRRFTTGSQVQSALGCISMQPTLIELFDKVLRDAQEKADKAQEAADRVAELMAGMPGGDEPGAGGSDGDGDEDQEDGVGGEGTESGPGGAELQEAVAAAEAAQADLDAELDAVAARVGQVCRQAGEAAAEEADERAEAMQMWGTSPGEWSRMDPDEYLELADQVNTPELRDIARIFGAMKNLTIGARKEKFDTVPTEVFDVELGQNLGRLLPSEYLGLIVDEMEDEFYRRFAGKQLLQYRLRSIDRVARGKIVLLEDSSGSMSGQPHRWAKAFGLALGAIARDDDRGFDGIEFGSRGEHVRHSFPDRAAWTTPATVAYAEGFLAGGTDFESALDAAADVLDEEHTKTGKVSGDIVMLTDGFSGIATAWLDAFKARQEVLGFKVYVLLIGGGGVPDVINQFASYVGDVTSFHDGADVREIFRAVSP